MGRRQNKKKIVEERFKMFTIFIATVAIFFYLVTLSTSQFLSLCHFATFLTILVKLATKWDWNTLCGYSAVGAAGRVRNQERDKKKIGIY